MPPENGNQGYSSKTVQNTPGLAQGVENKYGETENAFQMSEVGVTGPAQSSFEKQKSDAQSEYWKKLLATYGPKALSAINPYLGMAAEVAGQAYLGKQQNEYQKEAEQRANAEYQRRLDDERAYNSPEAQAQRLLAAGINPLSVMTNGTGLTNHGVSSVTPSSPTRGNLSLTGAYANVASAQKSEAETVGQELDNSYQALTFVDRAEQVAQTLKQTTAQATLLHARAQFADFMARNEFDHAEQSLKLAMQAYQKGEEDIKIAKQDYKKGQIELAIARATAQTEIDLKKLSFEKLEVSLDILKSQRTIMSAEESVAFDKAYESLRQYKEQSERMEKENNWYGFNQIVNGATSIGNTAANVITSVYGGPLKGMVNDFGELIEQRSFTDKDGVNHTITSKTGGGSSHR